MSITCPRTSLAKHVNHRLVQSVVVSLHAAARVAEEHMCGKVVWPATKIQLDKTD